jgi:hypothetical protein
MTRVRVRPVLAVALALGLIVAAAGAARTTQEVSQTAAGRSVAKPVSTAAAPAQKAVLFAADGMRPDLVDKYAGQGLLPEMNGLMAAGVKGQNGLLQAFPPNTGVGWHTLGTGTWPGEHGSMNNTYHRVGEGNFNNRTSFATTGALQADHIAQAAERAGKKVVSVEWVGTRNLVPAVQGRSSTSARSSPTEESSSTTTCPGSLPERTRSASPTSASTSTRPSAGRMCRPPTARRCRSS